MTLKMRTMSGGRIMLEDLRIGDKLLSVSHEDLTIGGENLSIFTICVIAEIKKEVISFDIFYEGMSDKPVGAYQLLKHDLPHTMLFYDPKNVNNDLVVDQLKAYTNALRKGDALSQGGLWWEVVGKEVDGKLSVQNSQSVYRVSLTPYEIENWCQTSATKGYRYGQYNPFPYIVTKLEGYKIQGGEKFVWLGDTDDFRIFGQVYEKPFALKSEREGDNSVFIRDEEGNLQKRYNGWGVIPKYNMLQSIKDEQFTQHALH